MLGQEQGVLTARIQESGWDVAEPRPGRPGRSWAKLFRQLNKLLDDLYLACELDCSLAQVQAVVECLEASAEDFAELHSQLESVVSPSGQKVAWEVRACRRASNRSPRPTAATLRSSASGSGRPLDAPADAADGGGFGSGAAASASLPGSSWAAPPRGAGGASFARGALSAHGDGSAGLAPGMLDAAAGSAARPPGGEGGSGVRGKWSDVFSFQQHYRSIGQQAAGLQAPHYFSDSGEGEGAGGSGGGSGGGEGLRPSTMPPPLQVDTGGSGEGSGPGSGGAVSPAAAAAPPDSLYHKVLSSPSRKLSPAEVLRASEERQARAERARQAMAEERLARLAQAAQSRQTAKSVMEERAGAIAARVEVKIARSAELRQAHLAGRVMKAVEETKKVAEVAFINQMLEQDKKLALQEKLEEGESRRRQALEALQQRSKDAAAAVEEAQERRKLLEAERREQLADRQRRKEAAQAKLEEERRAAAAAREAASRAARAAAAQAAEARQRQRDVLSERIEERLREAAARRAQHLELIKERAVLGKDLYERRTADGPASSPRSPQSRITRPPSPEFAALPAFGSASSLQLASSSAGAGLGAAQQRAALLPSSGSGTLGVPRSSSAPAAPQPGLHISLSGSQLPGCDPSSPSPLRSSDRSITLSCDAKRRLKGMRRRVCKTFARLEAGRPEYTEPPHLEALLDSPEGRELVAAWRQLVEAARKEATEAAAAAATAPGQAPAGKRRRRRKRGGEAAAEPGAPAATAAPVAGQPAPVAAGAAVKHLLQQVHTDLGGRRKGIALHAARPSGLLEALADLLTAPAAVATPHPQQTSIQLMELLALLVTSSHHNAAWLLARGGAASLAGLVRAGMGALDRYNGLAADEVWGEPPEARFLAALLQALASLCRAPVGDTPSLHEQQEQLVAFIVACGLVHRSTELFSLFDQPAANETAPIPGYVLQCLALLEAITGGPGRRSPSSVLTSQKRWSPPAANAAAIVLSFQETSMAGLPSLLTAVLLRAAPSCTPAEARPERLPPNFVDAAACVMRVLNNVARLDLPATQTSLGAADLRVVFFHLVGFLLSYCTNQWPTGQSAEPAIRAALAAAAGPGTPAAAPATLLAAAARTPSTGGATPAGAGASVGGGGGSRSSPQASAAAAAPPPPLPQAQPAHTGLVQLLNEVLLLLGHYAVLQPPNQDVLLWGKSPTLLQRLAEVPRPYFEDQQLYQVLMPTLLAVCHGSERAVAALAQHMELGRLREYVQAMLQRHAPSGGLPAATEGAAGATCGGAAEATTSDGDATDTACCTESRPGPQPTVSAAEHRYSLAQRFPPELLSRAQAFLDRQAMGARVQSSGGAGGNESSLALAVAAALDAGPVSSPVVRLSLEPLAVLSTDAGGPASPISTVPTLEVPSPSLCLDLEAALGDATAGQAGAATAQGEMSTPVGRGKEGASPDGSSGGSMGSRSSIGGRPGGSGGRRAASYSQHFRRYLDAGDVPVPFPAGGSMGVRRQRLMEAAAAAAVAAVAAEGATGGGVDGGGNCARSYVSELSFGGYLAPSSQRPAILGEEPTPAAEEEERALLDELSQDQRQYEQQRLDEQQQLDEQDVLLLDTPTLGRGRARVQEPTAEASQQVEDRGHGESTNGGSAAARTCGALDFSRELAFAQMAHRRQAGLQAPAATGFVMDAWWRKMDLALESDGMGSGSSDVDDGGN